VVDEKKVPNQENDSGFDINVEYGGMNENIEAEINQHMARLSRELEKKFGPEFRQEIETKIARKVEKATAKAEKAADKGRFRSWTFSEGVVSSPSATQPQREKSVSPEEQLKILKMVESGSITPEEAHMLLEALEG
jgi:hypothetical protein